MLYAPPSNPDAERSVLGAIILNHHVLPDVVAVLGASGVMFYVPAHATVYEAMVALNFRGQPVDEITLLAELAPSIDEVGGPSYISDLCTAVPTSANAVYYAEQVRDAHSLRRLQGFAGSLAERIDAGIDARTLMGEAEKEFLDLSEQHVAVAYRDLDDGLDECYSGMCALAEGKTTGNGILSGLSYLDDITTGWKDGDLIVVASRPSVGKTAFALNMLHAATVKYGYPGLIFSLEMSQKQLTQRLLCLDAGADYEKIRKRFAYKPELVKLSDARERLRGKGIKLNDTPSLTLWEIRSLARRHHMRYGKGLIIVDYLQLAKSGMKAEKRYIEVGDITRGLKALARELNCPVMVLCQLGRSVREERDPFKMKDHLRESGDIEQDADLVLILSRLLDGPKDYANTFADGYGDDMAELAVTITVAKHRNGPIGRTTVLFDRNSQRFLIPSKPRPGPVCEPGPEPDPPSTYSAAQIEAEMEDLFSP